MNGMLTVRLVLLLLGMVVQIFCHPLTDRCVEPRGPPFEASDVSKSTNQRLAEPAQAARLSSPTTSSANAPTIRSHPSHITASRLQIPRWLPHNESCGLVNSVERRNVTLDAGRTRHDGSTQESLKSNAEIILAAAAVCIAFLALVLTARWPPPWLRSATRNQDLEMQGGTRRPVFVDLGAPYDQFPLTIALPIQSIRMLHPLALGTLNSEEDNVEPD